MVKRGDIWWADLPEPAGSEPGFRRPVAVVQADSFNKSRIGTVVVVVLSSNLRLGGAPGNVKLPRAKTGIEKDSVANVSQIITLDKRLLAEQAGRLDHSVIHQIDNGIRMVLGL